MHHMILGEKVLINIGGHVYVHVCGKGLPYHSSYVNLNETVVLIRIT